MGNFLLALQRPYFVDGIDVGRKTTVYAQDLIVDDGCQCKTIEHVSAVSPDVERSVLAEALVVEAVDLRYLSRFVVATNESDAGAVAHLQRYQQLKGFDAIQATIHEITEEQVVGERRVSADAEELDEVEELAVDVAADLRWSDGYCHGCFQTNDVALLGKYFFGLLAELLDLCFGELITLAEGFDVSIEVLDGNHGS